MVERQLELETRDRLDNSKSSARVRLTPLAAPSWFACLVPNDSSSIPSRSLHGHEATGNLPGTTDRRIDALLTLLAENSTIVISGAKIAKEIGVTRQQVWRWIEKLRALGVQVKGHPRTGYHIERMPDILAPQLLQPSPLRHARSRAASTTSSKSIRRTPSPCTSAKRASRTAPSSSPKSKPPGAAAPAALAFGKIRRHLLQRPAAAADFARAGAAAHAGRRPRRARCRRGRSRHRSRHSLAQRFARGRQEILRHPHRNARRARPHALRRRGHRHEREPDQDARADSRTSPRRCAWKPASLIRASNFWSGCCATSTATTINFWPKAPRPILRRFAQVSSYFEGKRVRITTARKLHGHHRRPRA